MESEENMENMSENEQVKQEPVMQEEEGEESEPIPLLHKDENEENETQAVQSNAPEDEGDEVILPSTVEAEKAPVEEPRLESSIDQSVFVQPTPQHAALTNPSLKSVLDEIPPTPRHASPLQIALEQIHPSKVDGEDHPLTSPTERKEEGVQLPTGVCEFPVVAGDSNDNTQPPENGPESQVVDDPTNEEGHEHTDAEQPDPDQTSPEPTDEDRETEEGKDAASPPKDIEEDELEESSEPKSEDPKDDDDEFIVVSQEEAPLELAEEYPAETIEPDPPVEESVHETLPMDSEIWDPTESALMKSAGIRLTGPAAHIIHDEEEEKRSVVEVHEATRKDLPPSEPLAEVEDDTDLVNDPQHSHEPALPSPLPNVEDSPTEPAIYESQDQEYGSHEAESLNVRSTEDIAGEMEATDFRGEGDVHGVDMMDTDTEVKDEIPLLGVTGDVEDVPEENPSVSEHTESPVHEPQFNKILMELDEILRDFTGATETHKVVETVETTEVAGHVDDPEPLEAIDHIQRDVVGEAPEPEVQLVASQDEIEDNASRETKALSVKPTEEDDVVGKEPVSAMPAIESHEELEASLQNLEVSDIAAPAGAESHLDKQAAEEEISEVPSIKMSEEPADINLPGGQATNAPHEKQLVDETGDASVAQFEDPEHKPSLIEETPSEDKTKEAHEADLLNFNDTAIEVPPPIDLETAEESHDFETRMAEDQPTEEAEEHDLIQVPSTERSFDIPATAAPEKDIESHPREAIDVEAPFSSDMQEPDLVGESIGSGHLPATTVENPPMEDNDIDVPTETVHDVSTLTEHNAQEPPALPTEDPEEAEELALLGVPVSESITGDHSYPPTEETTPGDIEIESIISPAEPEAEQPDDTNIDQVLESPLVMEERSVGSLPAIAAIEEPESSADTAPSHDRFVPSEESHPATIENLKPPVEDVSEEPTQATEGLPKEEIEAEHSSVERDSGTPIEEATTEEPHEELPSELFEPLSTADEVVDVHDQEETNDKDLHESRHDIIPAAVEIAGVAVVGTAFMAQGHLHDFVDESLRSEKAEPLRTNTEHLDVPVDESLENQHVETAEMKEIEENSVPVKNGDAAESVEGPTELSQPPSTESSEMAHNTVETHADTPGDELVETPEPTEPRELADNAVGNYGAGAFEESIEVAPDFAEAQPSPTEPISQEPMSEPENVDTPTTAVLESHESLETVGGATEENHVVPIDGDVEVSASEPDEIKEPKEDASAEQSIEGGDESLESHHEERAEPMDLAGEMQGVGDRGIEKEVEEMKEGYEEDSAKAPEDLTNVSEVTRDDIESPVHNFTGGPQSVDANQEPVDPAPFERLEILPTAIDETESAPAIGHSKEPTEEPDLQHDDADAAAHLVSAGDDAPQADEQEEGEPVDKHSEGSVDLLALLGEHYLHQEDYLLPDELHLQDEARIISPSDVSVKEDLADPVSHVRETFEAPAGYENFSETPSGPALHESGDTQEHQAIEEPIVEHGLHIPDDNDHQQVHDAGEDPQVLSIEDSSSILHQSEIIEDSTVNVTPVEEAEERIPAEPLPPSVVMDEDLEETEHDQHTSVERPTSPSPHTDQIISETPADAAPPMETEGSMHEIALEHQIDEQYEPLEDLEEIPLAGATTKDHSVTTEVSQQERMLEESATDVSEIPVEQALEQSDVHPEIPDGHGAREEVPVNVDYAEPLEASNDTIADESHEDNETLQEELPGDHSVTESAPFVQEVAPQTEMNREIERGTEEAPMYTDESPDKDEYQVESDQPVADDATDNDPRTQHSEIANESHLPPTLHSPVVEPDIPEDEPKLNQPVEQAESEEDITRHTAETQATYKEDEVLYSLEPTQTPTPLNLESESPSGDVSLTAPVEEPSDDMEYVTVTPAETFLPGTIAPPPTPHVSKDSSPWPFYSSLIGASVEALKAQDGHAPSSREGYVDRPSRSEDEVIEPTCVSTESQTAKVNTVPPSESEHPNRFAAEDPSDIPLESEHAGATSSREIPDDLESDSLGFERAAALGLPVVIAAGSIGIMATATHSRQGTPALEQRDSPPTLAEAGAGADLVPAIHVETPTSPDQKETLEIHGPFIDPLKHHIQPDEISLVLSDSTALHSPQVPIPYEPTHLPPLRELTRPSTSYSWLGALFGPISPEIIEAQRTGWIVISTEMSDEPPVRRRSTKLRRRTRELFTREQEAEFRGCGIM